MKRTDVLLFLIMLFVNINISFTAKEMNIISDLDSIPTIPPFLRTKMIKKHIAAGEDIVIKTYNANHVYLLLAGTVTVSNEFVNGQRFTFAQCKAPSFIGEVECLAAQKNYAATVQALTPCSVLYMDNNTFLLWLEHDAAFAVLMAHLVAKKMYPTSNDNGTIKFMSSKEKLLHYLLRHYQVPADNELFYLNKRRQQIADELGTSVKTVNRCLAKFKTANCLSLFHGKIYVSPIQFANLQIFLQNSL